MLNTLIPVYGFMGVLKDVNAVKLENIEEETIDIDQQTNGLTSEILQSYEKSILKPVSKYLGIEAPSTEMFIQMCERSVRENIEFLPPYGSRASLYLRPTEQVGRQFLK